MSKQLWWWIAVGATLLTVITVGLAFVVTKGAEAFVPADQRWAALATQQQAAFLRTPVVVGAAPTRTPTVVRTVPAPVALISTLEATATPTATSTTTPTATPTATMTATVPSTPTVTPEATTIPEATATREPTVAATEAMPPAAEPTLPAGVLATVGVPILNLRTGPGLDFPIIASLPGGTAVALLGGREFADAYAWVEVAVDGRRGWLLGEPVGVR